MWAAILTFVDLAKEFFKSLPLFDKWFSKPTAEKVKDVVENVDDLQNDFIKGGARNEKK